MTEHILTVAKYAGLFLGSFYGFLKLAQIKLRFIHLLDILVSVALAAALYFATVKIRFLVPVGFLLLTFLYCLPRYRRTALNTMTICTISCGITIMAMAFAFIVIIPLGIFVFRFIGNETIRNCSTVISSIVLQLLAIFLIFRIKRLRSGISVRSSDGAIEILLLLSILSIFLMTLLYADNVANSPTELIVITITFCGLGLIIWWKKHVTNNYQKKLYKRNEDIYERRIEEYEKERGKLIDQNSELAKIIHRDNKLIPAMTAAVEKLIESAPDKREYEALLEQLKSLSVERNGLIDEYRAKADKLPKTGNCSLDAVIHYLNARAGQCGISIDFKIEGGAVEALFKIIKEPIDLNTVICDLGENAVIATRNTENGKILISFEFCGAAPCVKFYDNGSPFDKTVIENMGKKRVTTHKAEGGSGIGLMTLFEILNKYNASYSLCGRAKNGFLKCVAVSFDDMHSLTVEDCDGGIQVTEIPRKE